MLYLISGMIALSVFLIIWAIAGLMGEASSSQIQQRLRDIGTVVDKRTDIDMELKRPLTERMWDPLVKVFGDKFASMTPGAFHKMIEEKLFAAGGMGGIGVGGYVVRWVVFTIAAGVVGFGATIYLGLPANQVIGIGMIAVCIGILLPLLYLNMKIAKRRNIMARALPDSLDLVTVSVEAGLGFDGALAKLVEKMQGPLVDEFGRMLQEMRMGIPRRQALTGLADRCKLQDINLFTSAIIQADQLGVSIANVLRVQSEAIRERRKQIAEEKAMKAPIKLLLPLVLFVFPCIFIVLLGPAMISIMEALSKQ